MEDTTRDEVYEMGRERGGNVASWTDIPEVGSPIDTFLDWQGLGDVVTEDNQADYMEMLAFAAESNSRDFSPFEFTANELNGLEETADFEVWEAFDEGIADGIRADIAERLKVGA